MGIIDIELPNFNFNFEKKEESKWSWPVILLCVFFFLCAIYFLYRKIYRKSTSSSGNLAMQLTIMAILVMQSSAAPIETAASAGVGHNGCTSFERKFSVLIKYSAIFIRFLNAVITTTESVMNTSQELIQNWKDNFNFGRVIYTKLLQLHIRN
jgi:hypothetical protein